MEMLWLLLLLLLLLRLSIPPLRLSMRPLLLSWRRSSTAYPCTIQQQRRLILRTCREYFRVHCAGGSWVLVALQCAAHRGLQEPRKGFPSLTGPRVNIRLLLQ